MSDEPKFRSPRRPPAPKHGGDEPPTDRISVGKDFEVADESEATTNERVALPKPKQPVPKDRGVPRGHSGEAKKKPRQQDDESIAEALVFDSKGAPPADDGQTSFGSQSVPAGALDDKTSFLPPSRQEQPEQIPILTVRTRAGSSDVEVTRDRFVMGRAPESDVVIPDQSVSRSHAAIEHRSGSWFLVDLESGNGSFLNKKRVREAMLADRDVIKLGEIQITFQLPNGSGKVVGGQLERTTMLPEGAGGQVVGQALAGQARRKRRRLLLFASVVAALIGVLCMAKKWKTETPAVPEVPPAQQAADLRLEQQEREAEETFNKVVELVKQERWEDTRPMILKVAEVFPDDDRVKEYKTTIEREASVAAALKEAKNKAAAEDWDAAILELGRIANESIQFPQAQDLKKQYDEKRRVKRIDLMKKAFDAKNYNETIILADEVLQGEPGNAEVVALKRKAEVKLAKSGRVFKPRVKDESKPPPEKPSTLLIGSALASYRDGKVDQALSEAESAGVGPDGIAVLKRLKNLLSSGKELASNPSKATQAEKELSEARALDKTLGGGIGNVSEEIGSALAKVFFVTGVDAQNRKNYAEAFKSYKQALVAKPDMAAVRERLRELELEAKNLFEAAYVFKSTQSDRATANCKTVLQMVRSDYQYFTKCKKLLADLQGDEGGGSDEGGF